MLGQVLRIFCQIGDWYGTARGRLVDYDHEQGDRGKWNRIWHDGIGHLVSIQICLIQIEFDSHVILRLANCHDLATSILWDTWNARNGQGLISGHVLVYPPQTTCCASQCVTYHSSVYFDLSRHPLRSIKPSAKSLWFSKTDCCKLHQQQAEH